jgi:lipopolysaccharide transport system permease protein
VTAVAQPAARPSPFRDLIRARQLILTLTARDLKARYRGSVLGYFWSLANPLLLLAVYTIVFTLIFRRPVGVHPYALFLFIGILPWTFFAGATLESTNVLVTNGSLIKRVLFPAEALPIVVVLSHLVHFLLALPILLAALLIGVKWAEVPIGWPIVLAPAIMLLQSLFVAGVALAISSTAVLFRDLRDIVANLLNLGFFLTPILYPLDAHFIEDKPILAKLLLLNPMSSYVVAYQDIFFRAQWPATPNIFLMIGWALVAVSLGFLVFDRLRDTLAEAI